MAGDEDDELEEFILLFFFRHARPALKAILIGAVGLFAMLVFTGSAAKAATVAILALALSLFNTWRRYLEPISLVVFCLAVLAWANIDILDRLRSAIAMIRISLAS